MDGTRLVQKLCECFLAFACRLCAPAHIWAVLWFVLLCLWFLGLFLLVFSQLHDQKLPTLGNIMFAPNSLPGVRERERKRERRRGDLNHLLVHQWIRSAIREFKVMLGICVVFLFPRPPSCHIIPLQNDRLPSKGMFFLNTAFVGRQLDFLSLPPCKKTIWENTMARHAWPSYFPMLVFF